MAREQTFRLVRDALGFYSQVPLEVPVVEVVSEVVVPVVVVTSTPVKRKGGRPKKKLNAEFEVNV